MDKSLAPLIGVIALVILLSFIIINSDFSKVTDSDKEKKTKNVPPKVNLRPQPNEYSLTPRNADAVEEKEHLFKIRENIARARNLYAAGKTEAAEEVLRTLLVFDPNHPQALSLLGRILFYSSRYSEAEVLFRKQVRLDPRDPLAYNRLGSTLAKQKRYKEAIANSKIALGINPESGQAHVNLSGMYSVTGDKEKAIKHFQEAYRLLGYSVLQISFDEAFDNIRDTTQFQDIISKIRTETEKNIEDIKEPLEPVEEPLFKSK
jgi:Flp pilus assembly protein TadD